MPVKLTTTEQITKITKTETPFGVNFEITYDTEEGEE